MRDRKFQILFFVFILLFALTVYADDREPCPETGTSFDELIKEAYDCHGKFLEADASVGHGVIVLKELFATVLEKTEEEKEEIMAMTDSSFITLIADEEVQKEIKEKLNENSEATLDTLKTQLDESLLELRIANDAALELSKKIPEAIKKLPSEFKGLNKRKIPKVKAALEKVKEWMDDVIAKASVDVEKVNAIVGVVKFLIGGEE
ncbi:MAG: hypothetical protein E3J87_07815 [Candidatus Cloacimonadota bacterium]|nr:MAG: hypothetical protein E3J87_07815 [Candidatus Cloacimonadota bacterium]